MSEADNVTRLAERQLQDVWSARKRVHQEWLAGREDVAARGVAALHRLLPVAQSDTGQSRRIGRFLLALYNGPRFPFNLTSLRGIDLELWQDCMALLELDYAPPKEIHRWLDDGSAIFEALAATWGGDP